jgi:hypothetical protein
MALSEPLFLLFNHLIVILIPNTMRDLLISLTDAESNNVISAKRRTELYAIGTYLQKVITCD